MPRPSPLAASTSWLIILRTITFACFQMNRPIPTNSYTKLNEKPKIRGIQDVLAPGSPIMDLLDPILTCSAPEIVPDTTIILGVVSSFFALFAAAVN